MKASALARPRKLRFGERGELRLEARKYATVSERPLEQRDPEFGTPTSRKYFLKSPKSSD